MYSIGSLLNALCHRCLVDRPESLVGHCHRRDPKAEFVANFDGLAFRHFLLPNLQRQIAVVRLRELQDGAGHHVDDLADRRLC